MKILLVEYRDWFNPRAGGAELALREVFRRLVARGWEVDYLCSAARSGEPDIEADGIRILRRGPEPLFGLAAVRALHGELRGVRYDRVVEGIDKLPFFLPWLAPRHHARAVAAIVPHLLGATAREAAGFAAGTAINAGEALLPLCYKDRTLITGAESTRQELIARGCAAKRVRIVPYGLDHELHRPGADAGAEGAPVFLYVGRLRKYKGLETALRALARIASRMPDVRLIIAGRGDDRARLERLANELGLGAAVEFRGFVSEEEKVALMRSSRALVYPSRKEGWGLPVIEAAACGTPAIAADADGLRDAVRDGESGLLVPPGDVAALGEAMFRVATDDALRARLRAGALAWAATFGWDRSADAMAAALETI